MRDKKSYSIDGYLDDILGFDGFENFSPKPMYSEGVEKDSLRGQKLNIEVFKIHFPDTQKNSYVWGMNKKIVAAGSMKNAWEVLDEISTTYRLGSPEHIYLHFPKKAPMVSMADGNGRSHILPLTSAEVANFDKSLTYFKIFSIAQETSAS